MISGGNDGVVKVVCAARRPSIRPKPVTPPRSAAPAPLHQTGTWTLPPVRTPAPRMVVAKRPVLALVEQDESTRDVTSVPTPVEVLAWWRQPRAVALVVASVLAAAFATTAVVWTASARRDAAEATEAVGTTTLASASLSVPVAPSAPEATAVHPRADEPVIPVVDVNRLPSVPNQVASGAAH